MVPHRTLAVGPAPVDLRSADHFAILAGSAITSGGGAINGDVGLSPGVGSLIGVTTSQVNGIIYAVDASGPAGSVVDPGLLTTSRVDFTTAYNDAAGRTNPTLVAAGALGGLTLSPGLYKDDGAPASLGLTGTLTLDAHGDPNAVWIFQSASTLITATGAGNSQVVLTGGAQARNVFWQVGSSATIGVGSVFKGSILAAVDITMDASCTVEGRALAGNALTFNGQSIGLQTNFRSAANGNWSNAATWERFDGGDWVAAAATPSSADGVITLRSGHTVTVTADVTVDQVVVAAGGQVTVSSGITWTVADGAGTDLDLSGTLLVNGSLSATSAVTVKSGATLGGTGAIDGNVTVNSGGTVAPGVGVGTLTVGGSVTFESGSTCTVEVSASPNGNVCDKLNVTGTLTLGGATLTIGTLSGDGCMIATNAGSIVGTFSGLANGTQLPAPNASYYIHYVDNGTDDYIVLNQSPTAAEAIIRAYAAAGGVVVEFQSIDEAGNNDMVLYLYQNGQWVEVGRRPAAGAGSHMYRFVVPGLNAGDIANLLVRDDEGQFHTASNLAVGNFSARLARVDNTGLTLQWESIPGRTYDIYRAERLKGPWEVIEPPVEAAQTQTVTLISIDPAKPIEFFKIGLRE